MIVNQHKTWQFKVVAALLSPFIVVGLTIWCIIALIWVMLYCVYLVLTT